MSVTCGSSWPSFTVTGVISSNQATQVSYEWVRGDGSVAGPATVAIAAGGTADVTDSVDPSSSTYSSTDTLRVTSPVAASASIPLSVSCVPSHVTGVSVSVGSVDEDAYTDCAEPVTALVTIAVTTSNTGPVTLTWALSESQSESPGSTTATGGQAFSGHTSYSLIFTGTFSQTCPALIMPYFLAATATATGGDGQAVTAQGYSEVYPVT